MNSQHYAENISELVNRTTRTRFPIRGCQKLLTMNKGLLYPVYTFEVLPGDTWQLYIRQLIRATTLIKPIMNNIWIQVQCFFVPNRLVDPHWEEIMGSNKQGPWITNKTIYTVPKLTAPDAGWNYGSLADYLGIRPGVANIEVNSYYTKGYCQVWNDWYRDENRQNFTYIQLEGDVKGTNGTDYVQDAVTGGTLLPVAKRFDLFSGSSIDAQKGPDVLLPLGTYAPVVSLNDTTNPYFNSIYINAFQSNGTSPMGSGNLVIDESSQVARVGATIGSPNSTRFSLQTNLSEASSASVNQLRLALALQQMYELDALSGTRYTEIIFSHFGVRSSDARLQRSEYLGGKSIPLGITQVIQTSETTSSSSQGNLSGMSQTWDGDEYFTKSFEEHGILYVMACIKGENIYQQGLHAKFSKFSRTDYYDPIFANIGLQPIKNSELFVQGSDVINPSSGKPYDEEAFGYKEAWDEYRVFGNEVAGEFRSDAPNSLDVWHIARDFSELPTNGEDFIIEGQSNLDRALTVPSSTANQFQCQFVFDGSTVTRVMPAHSVPGLKRF